MPAPEGAQLDAAGMVGAFWQGTVPVLSTVLAACGGAAAAEPHLEICFGGFWSVRLCWAAQGPCPGGKGCSGMRSQWESQCGGQSFLCPRSRFAILLAHPALQCHLSRNTPSTWLTGPDRFKGTMH